MQTYQLSTFSLRDLEDTLVQEWVFGGSKNSKLIMFHFDGLNMHTKFNSPWIFFTIKRLQSVRRIKSCIRVFEKTANGFGVSFQIPGVEEPLNSEQ